MTTLPPETAIQKLIPIYVVAHLERELRTAVDVDDAARLVEAEAGYWQDRPVANFICVYECAADGPEAWPHLPDTRMIGTRRSSEYVEVGATGFTLQRAFTMELWTWGRFISGLSVDRDDVAHINTVLAQRAWQALRDGGAGIGTGGLVQDGFEEYVVDGPFRGKEWLDEQESESLKMVRYLQFWYRTHGGP